MSRFKKVLLHSMLAVSLFAFPAAGFSIDENGGGHDEQWKERVPQDPTDEPEAEEVSSRFGVGVYYGRPYYGGGYYSRPYYGGYYGGGYYRPYYRHGFHGYNYYPHRYYGHYGW